MSLHCPKDGTQCPDDVCRGSRCVLTDTAMLERCTACGVMFDPDHESCDCPPADDDFLDYPDGPLDHAYDANDGTEGGG